MKMTYNIIGYIFTFFTYCGMINM